MSLGPFGAMVEEGALHSLRLGFTVGYVINTLVTMLAYCSLKIYAILDTSILDDRTRSCYFVLIRHWF